MSDYATAFDTGLATPSIAGNVALVASQQAPTVNQQGGAKRKTKKRKSPRRKSPVKRKSPRRKSPKKSPKRRKSKKR